MLELDIFAGDLFFTCDFNVGFFEVAIFLFVAFFVATVEEYGFRILISIVEDISGDSGVVLSCFLGPLVSEDSSPIELMMVVDSRLEAGVVEVLYI